MITEAAAATARKKDEKCLEAIKILYYCAVCASVKWTKKVKGS